MTDKILGRASGTWLEPNKGNFTKPTYKGVNTNQFLWGVAHPGLPQENGLTFAGTDFTADFDQAFTLGDLSFFNSAMADTNTIVESVPLSIELALDSLGQTKKFNFSLELETTLDVGPDPNEWADFVYFPSVLPKETFTVGGKEYTLEILGFSKDKGKTLENRFRVLEIESDTAQLVGKITAAPKKLIGDKNATEDGAKEITKIDGKGTFINDEIGFTEGGVRDLSDMYEFTLDNQSQVNITLDQLAQNANVEILNGDASTILFQGTNTGRSAEKITELLEKGTYFVRVYPEQTAKTKYRLGVSAKTVAGEKDTLQTAKDLGMLSPEEVAVADSVGAKQGKLKDQQDYYKFSVKETSEVLINLDQLKADADVKLLDAQGVQIDIGNKGGKNSEQIFKELPKGDYYLQVLAKGSASTSYVLSATANPPAVDADDLKSAISLGTVKPGGPIGSPGQIGWVVGGRRDTVDYYSFNVDTAGEVKVRLDGFLGNVNVELLNAKGESVGESDSDKKSKLITLEDAELGAYNIVVKADSKNRSDYAVTVDILPPYEDDYPTYQTAFDFGTIAQTKKGVANNKVGFSEIGRSGRDETDFFKFKIDQESFVDINLGQLKGNADIILWEQQGNGLTLLSDSKNKGRKGDNIGEVLDAGTYYVQVEPFGNERTPYQLSVNVQDKGQRVQEFKVGDLIAQGTYESGEEPGSKDIGMGTSARRNEVDRYNFSLSKETDLIINLDDLKADADLRLYKKISGGTQLIKTSTERGKSVAETIEEEGLGKGDYILEVVPYGSAKTPYQLTMSTGGGTDPDGGDNGRVPSKLVQDLGVLTTKREFEDNIGRGEGLSRDQKDFYKFTVSQDTDVQITLNPDMANANLRLLDGLGSLVDQSSNSGTQVDVINYELEAGKTYYVEVLPALSDRTDYTLTLEPTTIVVGGDPDGGPLPDSPDKVLDIRSQFAGGDYSETNQIGFQESGYRDVNDYRWFSISQKSNFSLDLTNLKQNADVFLVNQNNTQIASSTKAGTTSESINKVLEPGDYYARIVPKGTAQTTYNLNMSADPITGVGDDVSPGTDLGTLSDSPLTASDLLGFNEGGTIDKVDYYNFTLNSAGFVNIDLKRLSNNADIDLYNTKGQLLGSSNNTGSADDNINPFLDAGKYIVKVFNQGTQTPYELGVSLG